MRAAGKYWTGSVRPQVEKAGGVCDLALLILVVVVATSAFLYLHEWGHAFGFWLDGLAPCVGLNSSWPASPNADVKTLMGGLFGPLLGIGLGLLFLALHFLFSAGKKWTMVFSLVNLVAHPFAVCVFIYSFLVYGSPLRWEDEGTIALMLPETSSTSGALNDLVGGVDRGFLFDGWSLAVVWPGALPPLVAFFSLMWFGRPLGSRRAVTWFWLVVGLCVASAFLWAWVAEFGGMLCF
tara:strand:- start:50 stop:760 length:711 start_codon:yes stop_codon:yes gene_type:complete